MYEINNITDDHYFMLTGVKVQESLKHLCWECQHRLIAFVKFRQKALRSHHLLQSQSYRSPHIDRRANNLESTLSIKHYTVNHTDINIDNDVEESKTNLPIQEINIDPFDDSIDLIDDKSLIFDGKDNSSTSSDEVLAKQKRRNCKKSKLKLVKSAKEKRNTDENKIDKRRKPANEVLNEELFSIIDLSYEEQVSEILKRQESSNYRNAVYKCNACFKGFLDEAAYNTHVIRHTDQSGHYECAICKTHFKQSHALRNHITSHMQKFICKCCPYVTTRRHAAKLHEEWHNGTKYQCPHCQEYFLKFSTYMGHIRMKHPSDIVCEVCGYSFVSDKGLALHKKLKHRFEIQQELSAGPFCNKCNVHFHSNEAYNNHKRLSSKHNSDEENGGKKSRRNNNENSLNKSSHKGETNKRRNINKPEGPISCEQCDMELPDPLSYYRHFRRTHPDKNRTNYPSMKSKSMCEVCGKMFQSLALLQDHSFTHSDSKQFKCAQCNKTFQRKYRLIAHERLHRSIRATHTCSVCQKQFTTASNKSRHMFSHTGLKPFKCEMCGKSFKHASEKRAHITYVHLKKPWPKRARGKRRHDNRQNQPQLLAASASETDIVEPLWPGCNDPKIGEIVIDNKPVYYNLKI